MRKLLLGMLITTMLVAAVSGCADTKTPKGAILSFFKAIKSADEKKIGESLAFDKLLVEQMGEAYLSLSPEEKANRVEEMRQVMVAAILGGKLSFLKNFEPEVDKVEVKGDQAVAYVHNSSNKQEKLVMLLVREGGVWKIFSISGDQPA